MQNKLFKNSTLYIIGDFLQNAVSGFLLLPFYTRTLTQMEFGVFSIINTSVTIVVFFIHFGMISTYARVYFDKKSAYEKKVFTGQMILLHLAISLAVLLGIYLLQRLSRETFLVSVEHSVYYYYILGVSILSFMNALYSVYLRIHEEAEKFLFFQLASIGLYVALIFLFYGNMENTLDAILLASFCSIVIMWLVAIRNLEYIFAFNAFVKHGKNILSFSFPIFLGYVMYFLLNKFNILFLQYYETLENIALFSFALQLSGVLTIFAASMGKAIQPVLYKSDKEHLRGTVKKVARYFKMVMTICVLFFIFFSEYIIAFFAPESYETSREVFIVLLLSVFIYNLRFVESHLFMYFHTPRYTLYIVTMGAVAVLFFSFLLVDSYGYLGSAYAILGGSVVVYLANKYYSYRLVSWEYR